MRRALVLGFVLCACSSDPPPPPVAVPPPAPPAPPASTVTEVAPPPPAASSAPAPEPSAGLGTIGAAMEISDMANLRIDGGGYKGPTLRQGATQVNGRLPPEVIQRIVRQNYGRFRLCYENGLRRTPTLAGVVSTKFIIDKSGSVTKTEDAGSTLPDDDVKECVRRGMGNLSFPQPDGGIVTVVYPIIMNPS